MTKIQIVNEICSEISLPQKEVSRVIEIFLDKIKSSVNSGQQVEIRGFGSFYRKVKKARKIKSPIAGSMIAVPEKSILAFKGSKKTERYNQGA